MIRELSLVEAPKVTHIFTTWLYYTGWGLKLKEDGCLDRPLSGVSADEQMTSNTPVAYVLLIS